MTQKEAFNILKLGHNVFLTGPPGSGKTFLLNKYVNYLKSHRKKVAVTASTGIAATHMGGMTLHSWSGLGIKDKLSKKEMEQMFKRSYLKKRIKNTHVLIIDEISMLHAFQFDLVNQICQAFRGSFAPFGGMQVVCSGDFFQLPPVQKEGEAEFATSSFVWQNMDMKSCYLEEQYRQKENDNLALLLDYIRGNNAERAYTFLMNKKEDCSEGSVKLYTHNIDVDTINSSKLAEIDEEEVSYNMESRGNEKIVEVLKKNCLASEKLVLKKGAKVMFIKNNFEGGYVNGTIGKIVDFNGNSMPIVKTLAGKKIAVGFSKWTIEEEDEVKAEISQIPLRLAWAITVHKSQGMNLDAAEIDLSKCFLEGMGYVALSRLRSLSGLKLMGVNKLAFLINKESLRLDESFKAFSRKTAQYLTEMPFYKKERRQKQFLHRLG